MNNQKEEVILRLDCNTKRQYINSDQISDLKDTVLKIRINTVTTSSEKNIPHLGSCLSCLDILCYLYWVEMEIFPDKPNCTFRDRFILSKGHAAPVLFQILAARGNFDKGLLEDFGKEGGVFHEHPPAPGFIDGIEAATGSLGHGLPIGLGMALALRIKKMESRVYVVLGDGECNEGSIWEAAMLASAQRLANLTVIVDFNKWQATGRSCEIMSLEPLAKKWEAFGWHTQEINGHDIMSIDKAFIEARANEELPSVIIANTIKGKGVSFMEDDNNWHYRTPNRQELEAALSEMKNR